MSDYNWLFEGFGKLAASLGTTPTQAKAVSMMPGAAKPAPSLGAPTPKPPRVNPGGGGRGTRNPIQALPLPHPMNPEGRGPQSLVHRMNPGGRGPRPLPTLPYHHDNWVSRALRGLQNNQTPSGSGIPRQQPAGPADNSGGSGGMGGIGGHGGGIDIGTSKAGPVASIAPPKQPSLRDIINGMQPTIGLERNNQPTPTAPRPNTSPAKPAVIHSADKPEANYNQPSPAPEQLPSQPAAPSLPPVPTQQAPAAPPVPTPAATPPAPSSEPQYRPPVQAGEAARTLERLKMMRQKKIDGGAFQDEIDRYDREIEKYENWAKGIG